MSDVVIGFFATVAFIVIILFDVGIVTPYWITVEETLLNSTRSFTHGLFYSLDYPGNETVFDNLVIWLNIATSLCLTILPLFWSCIRCIICCRSSNKMKIAGNLQIVAVNVTLCLTLLQVFLGLHPS
ncbi:uncharacterized protein LOC134231230 [Saccostrea cucullata]|uniref:uncharacterized protein LOC134231230 n=1 Tax=Saccostrea cuccullata TaxID=36930 RepID=UPI002ED4CB2A